MVGMATAPSHEVFTCSGGGVRLVGDRWRADESRGAVVLMHGGGQTRHSWGRTAERLAAAGWDAVTYDARGHGDSEWDPSRDYTLDAFVGDLIAIVEMVAQAPVVVGASLGGMTGLILAGEHARLIRGLVLVDVVVELDRAGTARIIDFLTAHRDGFESLEAVAEAVAEYNPLRRRARNLDGLRKNVRQHPDGRWYWHWDPAFVRIGDEPQRQVDPQRLRAAAARVTAPTLLVRGARSDVVTAAGLEHMRRLMPTATATVVPNTGHMVAGDDNDLFVENLEEFLVNLP
jgi:pimeloyl-ACP methyl ester carboxylesterase